MCVLEFAKNGKRKDAIFEANVLSDHAKLHAYRKEQGNL